MLLEKCSYSAEFKFMHVPRGKKNYFIHSLTKQTSCLKNLQKEQDICRAKYAKA